MGLQSRSEPNRMQTMKKPKTIPMVRLVLPQLPTRAILGFGPSEGWSCCKQARITDRP